MSFVINRLLGQADKSQFYYASMDKYQTSMEFHRIDPTSMSFTRYNLCFSIANSKQTRSKHAHLSGPTKRQSSELTMRSTNLAGFFPRKTSNSVYGQSHSSTFYDKKKRQSQYLLPGHSNNQEFDYVKSGFPQRKKKSGQQQLLKLLLKFTDNLQTPRPQIVRAHKSPLYQNPQKTTNGIIPTLKTRTRFNWIKDRYCINRTKQGEGYIIPQTERPVHPPSLSRNVAALRRNLSLLRME